MGKFVIGMDELLKDLEKLPDTLSKKYVRQAMVAGQQIIMDDLKSHVPVDTGTLRDSIKIESKGKNGNIYVNVITTVPYAAPLEYGTDKKPADGTFRRVADSKQDEVAEQILNAIGNAVEKELRP